MQKNQEPEQAGLLWRLLEQKTRHKIARLLSLQNLDTLNKTYQSYSRRSPAERRRIELAVLAGIRTQASVPKILFFSMCAFCLTLLTVHILMYENMTGVTRLALFTPLLLGCAAPLTLYLLPAHSLRILFRPQYDPETLMFCFFTLLALIWILAYIGFEDTPLGRTPRGFSLLILCLGAVTAPLIEEVFFREFLPGLFGSAPHYGGHLFSVLLFSLAHLPADFYMGFLYALAAFFLTLLRIQSGGLLFPYGVHALGNLSILLLDV